MKLRHAEHIAGELGRVVDGLSAWRGEVPDADSLGGPDAAVLRRDEARIGDALERFVAVLRDMRPAKRAMLRDVMGEARFGDALERVRAFHEWFVSRGSALKAKADSFGAQFATDLRADAERQRDIAREWSAVDGDGMRVM